MHDDEAADGRDGEPREARDQRPAEASETLRGEVERQTEPEEAVGRPDDVQIGAARGQDVGILAEDAEPHVRRQRRRQPDGAGQHGGHRGARPHDATRACVLSGTDVGTDHRHQRRAQPEHERDLQIFQARADAVAGERVAAEGAHQAGEDHDRQVGLDGVERAGRAHAQDVPERPRAKPQAIER